MENEVIYKITSPKGKVYIGRTKDFIGRMSEHKHIALKHKSDYSLYKAIRKYGWDNFQREILCEVNKDIAPKLEEEFILAYDSVKRGYNNTYAGHGGNMFINNPELKEKQRISLSKRFTGTKNPMFGKSHSDNTKELQKEKAKGRYSLDWFIDRNGDTEGKRLYEERRQWLKNRNLKKDSNGRFISSS